VLGAERIRDAKYVFDTAYITNYDDIRVALAALRVAIAAVVKHEPTLKHKRDKHEAIEETLGAAQYHPNF